MAHAFWPAVGANGCDSRKLRRFQWLMKSRPSRLFALIARQGLTGVTLRLQLVVSSELGHLRQGVATPCLHILVRCISTPFRTCSGRKSHPSTAFLMMTGGKPVHFTYICKRPVNHGALLVWGEGGLPPGRRGESREDLLLPVVRQVGGWTVGSCLRSWWISLLGWVGIRRKRSRR